MDSHQVGTIALSMGAETNPRICRLCQRAFKPNRYWHEFCTPQCRHDWHRVVKAEAMSLWRERHQKTQEPTND